MEPRFEIQLKEHKETSGKKRKSTADTRHLLPKKQKMTNKTSRKRKRIRKRKGDKPGQANVSNKKQQKNNYLSKVLLNRKILYSTKVARIGQHLDRLFTAGARAVVRNVFQGTRPDPPPGLQNSKMLPKKLIPWENHFTIFMKRHKSCPYLHLLNIHCPDYNVSTAASTGRRKTKKRKKIKTFELKHVEYSKVSCA